jgi:2'-hydroxyisoflavone reductase
MQVIDVRDLARLVVLLLEKDIPGAFNAAGPAEPITLDDLLTACGVTDRVEVPEARLELPLLLPDPSWDVLLRMDGAAARSVGMPQTPLGRSVADTLAWDVRRGSPPLDDAPSDLEETSAMAEARSAPDQPRLTP